MQRIASKPGNAIAANNMFDVHAIKYHTNITPVYLPSWCGLTGANGVDISYSPIKSKPVLLGPYRDNIGNGTLVDGLDVRAWAHPIFANLTAELHRLPATPLRIRRMREVYDEYEWEQVAHRVLVRRLSQPSSGACTPRSDGRCAASLRMLVKRTAPARSAASTQTHSESVRAIPPARLPWLDTGQGSAKIPRGCTGRGH